ncbi:hydrogenase maturation protease [Nocardia sp. NPDC057030]|uniref:hydrogenase maturation protease n=1 Tax=unclassified Nocardia TaxID=2637762 RepID=UPI0036455C50
MSAGRPRRPRIRGDLTTTVLVAGIGNIFLGDDGFGPEVVRRLPHHPDPAVRVVDYGIRGMHLAYDLLDGWDALVLIDAVPNRGAPGSVRVFQAEPEGAGAANLDAHAMNPEAVFAGVRALGGTLPPTYVVGCQVENVEAGMGLSAPVAAAVDTAISAVVEVLAGLSPDSTTESAVSSRTDRPSAGREEK